MVLLFAAAVAAPLGAVVLAADESIGRCHVVSGDKFLPQSGSEASICDQVQRAIAAKAPGVRYTVDIQVLSRSRLSAKLVVDGRALPLQNFAVMDRNLSEGTIEHFANSLAAAVANAAK